MSRRRTGPRTPHERTELPEVQRADEAYAGRAEHTPTRNGRRDPGLRLCGMRDHRQPHGAQLARGAIIYAIHPEIRSLREPTAQREPPVRPPQGHSEAEQDIPSLIQRVALVRPPCAIG
jgi:hypothetical protein